MKLPFILGIKVLHRVHTQLDLEACMLTLSGDDGSVMEVLGPYKQMKALSLAVLAQLQVLETKNTLGKNVYACSAKQVKWLLKDPSVCVFSVLASAKAAELQMNAEELTSAYSFA